MEKVIEFAHNCLKRTILDTDICVDATIGNGHDTLFLARISKFVYGFDIQDKALENTNNLLEKNNISNFKLFKASHSLMNEYITEKVKGFIFNFGYLPTANKTITTKTESSLKAIEVAISMLDSKGIIALVVYPGHEEGYKESLAINEYVSKLNQKEFEVVIYQFVNQINRPPYTIIIERKN